MSHSIDKTDFFRTSDTTYQGCIIDPSTNKEVEVTIDFSDCSDTIIRAEQRRSMINKLFNDTLGRHEKKLIGLGFQTIDFRSNQRNFVLKPKTNIVLRIISLFFLFFKLTKSPSRVDYKISTAMLRSEWLFTPTLLVDLPASPPLQIDGIKEKIAIAKAYFDPFTKLATTLFQDYEPFHSWKDIKEHQHRDASRYFMCIEDDGLVAKLIKDKDVSKEVIRLALVAYRDFIHKQFGTSVITTIQTQYGFDLDDMIAQNQPLTPEIVYRVNVGTTHVEAADVEKLACDLKQKKPLGLRFEERVKSLGLVTDAIDLQNPEHFSKLAEVFQLTEAESDKIFTGRKLHGKITSWYTHGDEELFKPWVDQQELFQTCQKIPNRSWDCFYEDLAMILCKKHLHQTTLDPEMPYRVGALIPAPREVGQLQSYYKVTSWIHNSRGIFSYTLEPACSGSTLPVIKLYRSTAASAYTFDGASSITNDFNPLNSPGYEGSRFLEEHERYFFDKRTIPLWVGYHHLATKKLDCTSGLKEAYALLEASNRALIHEVESKYSKPSIKQFIRSHDSEFLDLIRDFPKENLIDFYNAWILLNRLRDIVKNHYEEDSTLVANLKNFLEKAAQSEGLEKRAKSLLSWWSKDAKSPTNEEATLMQKLKAYQEQACSQGFAREVLFRWSQYILAYAMAKKENIQSKIAQNIDFVGHSLGGACAERFMALYSAQRGRIPLPGKTISGRFFDDPAINDEDNQQFIDFGNSHSELLAALGAKFAIIRRQEASDPIPQSGETHLGATSTVEEQQKTWSWLRFDAAVQQASSKAEDPQVRDNVTAHGRMFAGASRKRGDWYRSLLHDLRLQFKKRGKLTKVDMKGLRKIWKIEKASGVDYKITHYCSKIQWNFDHHPTFEIWEDLHKLWKIPFPSWVTSKAAEYARSYLSAVFRSGLFFHILPKMISQIGRTTTNSAGHGEWKKYCDSNGVLVIKSSV